MSDTIYISRKCEHCHELLILLHKNKDILKFPVIDVHTKPYPKTVTSVPCMIIDGKVLPGQELFKFLNYLIQKNNTNNNQTNDLMQNEIIILCKIILCKIICLCKIILCKIIYQVLCKI